MAKLYQRKWLLIRLPLVLAAVAVATWLWVCVWPMPPTRLSISTAQTDGAYYLHAQRYAEKFAQRGVTLEILNSAGSEENLRRLREPEAPADLALIQGGFGYLGASFEGIDRSRVQTLANVDVEPVWLFSRNREIDSLNQLQGLRLAIGPEGSGHRKVALKLLEQARIGDTQLSLSPLTGNAAVQAMRQGAIDAVLMVIAPESAALQNMLSVPGIQIANLKKSAAITERNPYLESRLLAMGTLDTRLPPRDSTLLTTSTSLVARDGLHPALQRLAIAVAMEVHAAGGLFHRAGDFPSLRRVDFPTSPQTRDTLAHGLPWLERVLPFWWAQLAGRILLICLPLVLLAACLMRLIPAYLRWMLESRVNRWYGELKFIENDLSQPELTGLELGKFLQRLNSIDQALLAFATPKDLIARCYMLHQHIEFVRQRLYRMRGR
ncbi:MAG: TAXI family TRAP transporter solute-binding subunit [Polaromonas sp.]|nr:TAXI family TRAP transporter solute-binding subunit [Polaromonas sp.]